MDDDPEVIKLFEHMQSDGFKRKYPLKHPYKEKDSEIDLLIARLVIGFNKKYPIRSYTTAEIIKMESRQRKRSEATAGKHEQVALDMAVLVRVCGMGRLPASILLSYAQWYEYAPKAIKDFYQRYLPKEYRDKRSLCAWVENTYGGLPGFKKKLILKIDRYEQLCKKVPKPELDKLFKDLP